MLRRALVASFLFTLVFLSIHLTRQPGDLSGRCAGTCPEVPPLALDLPAAPESGGQIGSGAAAGEPSGGWERLPVRQQEWWGAEMPERVFREFREWSGRWSAAPQVERPRLEAEGVALAGERRRALADLISSDPERALQLAVPAAVRAELPPSVQALLERRLNARGDFFVAGAVPLPGGEDSLAPLTRWAEVGGERLRVFTHGAGLTRLTGRAVPLNGIALPASAATNPLDSSIIDADGLLALSASPVRTLDDFEVRETLAASGATPECPTSGQEVDVHEEPAGIELAGETFLYCGSWHAAAASAEMVAGAFPAPAGPDGVPMESAFTQGYKRLLVLRVDFPDHVDSGGSVTITNSAAQTLVREMRDALRLMSYGTHNLAPVGPGGSAITPVLRLPGNVASYDNEGLGRLLNDAKAAAAAAGYNPSNYDWHGVFTASSRPAASYAGLAWVGGVGFHMANGYFGRNVVIHELGHNLGLPHSHRWDTGDKSIIGPGTLVEYGNRYDPIGATYDSIPGEKHFVGSYKAFIDWIPAADVTRVTSSGLFRITTSDDINSRGRRLLRVPRDNRDYWVEFRQNLNDPQIQNGVFLQFANTDGRSSHLLDMLPGQSGVSLMVGRTFSDTAAYGGRGIHITPVAKGGTYPESMDVFVGVGPFAGNLPPRGVLSASSSAAPATLPIEFRMEARDPNNDTLAYHWDFGDGTYSLNNAPLQSKSFSSGGEYTVQCTVSDMKGGTHRDSMLVTVGAPAGFRISGRIVDTDSQPLSGIRLSATRGSEVRTVFTDSDGTYSVGGLAAGTWTLEPREIVRDSLNFANPFFTNPVRVGPSFASADFIGSSGPQETVTPLIPRKSLWKYYSRGAAPPGSWKALVYDDSTWNEGRGVLGYGNEEGQDTVVPFGSSSSNKWTTYFFRRAITVPNTSGFTSLRLEVLRDDGVVVYLNGAEVFRDNMPAGTPTYSTQASDTTEPSDYITRDIPLTGLVQGTNVIAAEVHQASPTSSDMAFDLSFSGVAPLAGAGDSIVAVTSPAAGQVLPHPAGTVMVEAEARRRNTSVTAVEFFVNNVSIGSDATAPYAAGWSNPTPGSHRIKAVASFADGQQTASAEVEVTVAAAPVPLIAQNATWRYLSQGVPAPSGWAQPGFDDRGWAQGAAELGFGDGDEATVIPFGSSNSRPMTVYFRREFFLEDPRSVTELVATLVRDDGAVVHLNGVEVARSNMPPGEISYGTAAVTSAPTEIENAVFRLPLDPARLAAGRNVVAVEVHQTDPASSDISFSLGLEAVTRAARPRGISLTAPTAAVLPQAVELEADLVLGSGEALQRVEFLADGQVVGEAGSGPFRLSWSPAAPGAYQLSARAMIAGGGTLTSAPVNLQVAQPPRSVSLLSFGDTWRFADDGAPQATSWTARAGFDDSAWRSGPARIGYGGDGELTLASYGNDAAAKFVTLYLRKRFVVSNPAIYSGLRGRLICDDGAVVHLNGAEIFRSNMPAGPVTHTTLATATVDGPAEQIPVEFAIPAGALVAGENLVAVEVHQAGASSSDLGFDLEILGQTQESGSFYLTSPAISSRYPLSSPITFSVHAEAGLSVERTEYFAGQARIGETRGLEPFVWSTPIAGYYPVLARATLRDGSTRETPSSLITVGEASVAALVIPAGSDWKYWDAGALADPAWKNQVYNDGQWRSGPARLGFGGDGEVTALEYGPVGPTGGFRSHMAYYFRRSFQLPLGVSWRSFIVRYQRDDGIVIYVNGTEVLRNNMPAGTITGTTPASSGVAGAEETQWFQAMVPAGLLRGGTNVIAAEVHQQNDTSSDLGFDLELSGFGVSLFAAANIDPGYVPPVEMRAGAGGASGEVIFRLGDEREGRLWRVECSDDLRTWTPFRYQTVRQGALEVPILPDAPARYYRAGWQATIP